MLPVKKSNVYLALGITDMRKSINTLSIMVEGALKRNPFSGDLFVFCNRRKTHIKVLYWENNGFCLLLKRLEKGRFYWPANEEEVINITPRGLRWLLDGLKLQELKTPINLNYKTVI